MGLLILLALCAGSAALGARFGARVSAAVKADLADAKARLPALEAKVAAKL